MLTTLTSYGKVSPDRQTGIMTALRSRTAPTIGKDGSPTRAEIQEALEVLNKLSNGPASTDLA